MIPSRTTAGIVRRLQTFALIALGVGTLGAGAVWRATSVRDALFERTERRLEASAGGTVAAVERWIEERRYDAASMAEEVENLAPRLATPGTRAEAQASLHHVLHRLRTGHGYLNAWAFDSAGGVVASAIPGEPSPEERAAAQRALAARAPRLCDPFRLADGRPVLCYAVAARDAGGLRDSTEPPPRPMPAMVIVLRSDPFGSLAPLVEASDGATGTERTQLVARAGDSIAILAGAHARPGTRHTIGKIGWEGAPSLLKAAIGGAAVRGRHRGIGGREVLGGARHVRGTDWAIVRRVDLAEILPGYRRQMQTELLLVGAALAAVVLAVASARRAERNRRLREVAASEARLAETLRASFDAVIAFDDAGCIQLFNAAAERLFRTSAAAMLGRPRFELFPARHRAFHEARAVEFMESAESSRSIGGGAEYVARRADGEEFAFEAIVSKGVANGGRLTTIVMRDVSERRRAEEERERTLSLLRATLEATADGILVVAPTGHTVVHNRQFAEIWRVPAEVLAKSDDERFLQAAGASVRDPEAFLERVHEIYGSPTAESVDVVELVDGRTIERMSRPQRIGERVVGRVWSFRDITERERATAALRQAEKLAAVGQFVSGVAHELNNPLAAVLLFTEEMLEEPRAPEDVETLGLIRDQARRARAIVRDLLAFVRGASGELATVDARELLEHAAHALDRQIAAEGGGGRVELFASGAPPLGAVRVDRAAVEQVVTNLVLNAAHAAPGSVVRIVASASGEPGGAGMLTVAVQDDGPGIAAHVLPRVFEPFFTTKPVGVGTGLGLSVSLGIAQRHGGTLRAENRAEGGARVVLTLPLVAAAPGAATSGPVALPPAPAARRRVLVVDDEPPVRRALRAYFVRRDWEVEEAEHGGPALARLLDDADEAPFDLIISDLRMPGVSGAALHDRLAALRPDLLDRLVIATGDVVSVDAAAFVARTRCVVLEKPFEPSALDAMLRAIVAEGSHPPRAVQPTRV